MSKQAEKGRAFYSLHERPNAFIIPNPRDARSATAFEAMKKIGIVGGVAWPSTVDYYTEICRRGERRHTAGSRNGPPSTPEMSIESLDLSKALSYIGVDGDDGSWSRFDEYHRAALQRLEASGADFALIASNTPHHRFDGIVRGVGIHVINIWEEAAKECARLEAEQILILGTTVTMRSPEFLKRFAEQRVEAAGPQDGAARTLTAGLIAELQSGKTEGAAERIGRIAGTSFARQFTARPVVCLACTELPLAFPEWKTLASFSVDASRMSTARPCTLARLSISPSRNEPVILIHGMA